MEINNLAKDEIYKIIKNNNQCVFSTLDTKNAPNSDVMFYYYQLDAAMPIIYLICDKNSLKRELIASNNRVSLFIHSSKSIFNNYCDETVMLKGTASFLSSKEEIKYVYEHLNKGSARVRTFLKKIMPIEEVLAIKVMTNNYSGIQYLY